LASGARCMADHRARATGIGAHGIRPHHLCERTTNYSLGEDDGDGAAQLDDMTHFRLARDPQKHKPFVGSETMKIPQGHSYRRTGQIQTKLYHLLFRHHLLTHPFSVEPALVAPPLGSLPPRASRGWTKPPDRSGSLVACVAFVLRVQTSLHGWVFDNHSQFPGSRGSPSRSSLRRFPSRARGLQVPSRTVPTSRSRSGAGRGGGGGDRSSLDRRPSHFAATTLHPGDIVLDYGDQPPL